MRNLRPASASPLRFRPFLPAFTALVLAISGCATGNGGETTGTTSTPGGGDGGGGEGGATTGGGAGDGGVAGGMTTTSTDTASGPCSAPTAEPGFGVEVEPNGTPALATLAGSGDQGWTAAICPAGDIDVFAIPIVNEGASLTISVRDVNGGCPPGAQLYLRLFDPSVALVAEDMIGGQGNCPEISPAAHPQLASLSAGLYYAQIESVLFTTVDTYVVEIFSESAGCGDGVLQPPAGEQCDDGNTTSGDGCTAGCLVETVCGDGAAYVVAGEQCDDGNLSPGDGCSSTCQLEANLLTETEPNNEAAPNSIVGYDGAVGSISHAGDVDWYSFEVAVPGSSVTLYTSDGFGGCPVFADTKISLHSPANIFLAEDDDDGVDLCSFIGPIQDPSATNLPAGTYRIRVEDLNNDGAIPLYVLFVDVHPPGCGDGVVQSGEQCDDAGNAPGDNCSPTCQLEGNYLAEVEPNPFATPNSLDGYDGAIVEFSSAADLDAFSFTVPVPDTNVIILTSNGIGACPDGLDTLLRLYDPSGSQIALDDASGPDFCSMIAPNYQPGASGLGPGTHTVTVEPYVANTSSAAFVLDVKVIVPACGDGFVTGLEQCDDGDLTPGDGCTEQCVSESPWEIEPNGALASATPRWPGTSSWNGSIQSLGDQDWYQLTVGAGQSVTLAVHTIGDPGACPFDSLIHFVGPGGAQIVKDDDGGIDKCSLISPASYPQAANLPAGPYYVRVEHYGGGFAAGPYQLDVSVQ